MGTILTNVQTDVWDEEFWRIRNFPAEVVVSATEIVISANNMMTNGECNQKR